MMKSTKQTFFSISVYTAVFFAFYGNNVFAQNNQGDGFTPSQGSKALEQISAPAAKIPSLTPSLKAPENPPQASKASSDAFTKENLEAQAKEIEERRDSQNQPDYSLVVYPQPAWKEPPASQAGWQSYYLQVRFLLKGGLSHRMSDVVSLSIDAFESAKEGNQKDRDETSLQALNAVFTDEGTTGKAHANQNGLTNIFLTSKGGIEVKRSSLCTYEMPLAHHSTSPAMMKLIYLPNVKLPERCGDVPIGMELDIVSGAHEELLQKLYCDDFPKASYCSPSAEHWTIPEFKQP